MWSSRLPVSGSALPVQSCLGAGHLESTVVLNKHRFTHKIYSLLLGMSCHPRWSSVCVCVCVFKGLSGVGAAARSGPERQVICLLARAVARVFNRCVIVLIFCPYWSRRDAIDEHKQEPSTLNPLTAPAPAGACGRGGARVHIFIWLCTYASLCANVFCVAMLYVSVLKFRTPACSLVA